jgi:hypothetical protein
MWFRRCEPQKIIPVAGHEYAASVMGELENGLVRGIAR